MRTVSLHTHEGQIHFQPTRDPNTLTMSGPRDALARLREDFPGLKQAREITPDRFEVDKELIAGLVQNVVYTMANWTGESDDEREAEEDQRQAG